MILRDRFGKEVSDWTCPKCGHQSTRDDQVVRVIRPYLALDDPARMSIECLNGAACESRQAARS
jgi:hypothetical protein